MRLLRRSALTAGLFVPAAVTVLLWAQQPAYANVPLTQVSTDTFTNTNSQHRTEVEPDTFQFGSTIVAAFQVGRIFGGASADIGFAVSNDNGATWSHGFLPGLTVNFGGGTFTGASDPAVAFDARHNVWLISSLLIGGPNGTTRVVSSRSTDGGHTWANPVTTASGQLDKNWIVCDNTSTSPFFGNCYTEYDITNQGNALRMS